jgi:hypothetical protein
MSETFTAVLDALQRGVVPTYQVALTRAPDLPRPPYLPEIPPQSRTEYLRALAKLGKLGVGKVN